MERKIGSMMRKSGLALTVAAGCWFAAGTPAEACSGPQRSNPNLGAAYRQNLAAFAKLLPPSAARPVGRAGEGKAEPMDVLPPNPPTVVGLWQVSYLSGGQVVDMGYDLWHADGTEVLVDIAPPATDNVCNGVWVQTGTLNYRLTHPSWTFDMNGNLTGTAMIRNTITLDRNGDTFIGTFTVDVYDNAGKQVDHLEGELTATRIKPV